MRKRDDMTFPFEEYERRLNELRTRMADRLLDAVVITDPSNLMYLTDYQTTGYSYFQALIVPQTGEPAMITRKLEESNVIARTWVDKTFPFEDTGDAIQMLVNALGNMGLLKQHIGYERNSYFFPAYQQDRLLNSFTETKLYDCYGIVEESRMCKSHLEIKLMKKAAKATEAGMIAGLAACKVGISENEIAAEISSAMFKAGGEFPAVMPYVTTGPRSMIGHATWEGRTLQENEHAFIEIGGCYRRYHTAMMRTAVTNELTDSMHKAQEIMKRAIKEIHTYFRPGLTISNANALVRDIIMDNDIGATLITRAGYSIGIAFPPSWDEGSIISLKAGDNRTLEKGVTFHVIPWMWGVDGDKTVGISDTIHITNDGCESFFELDQDFTVV